MLRPHLNRYVAMGAVGSCIWSAILPLVPLRLEQVRMGVAALHVQRALSQQEQQSVILFAVGAMVLLLAPLGIGWFVARGSIGARIGAAPSMTARFSALGGALSVSVGMLPLTTIIVFWNVGRSVFDGNVSGILAWLVVFLFAVSLGALGGALYFWMCAGKMASSRGNAENASKDFDTRS